MTMTDANQAGVKGSRSKDFVTREGNYYSGVEAFVQSQHLRVDVHLKNELCKITIHENDEQLRAMYSPDSYHHVEGARVCQPITIEMRLRSPRYDYNAPDAPPVTTGYGTAKKVKLVANDVGRLWRVTSANPWVQDLETLPQEEYEACLNQEVSAL